MTEGICISEMSVYFNETTQRRVSEDQRRQLYCRENLSLTQLKISEDLGGQLDNSRVRGLD